MGLVLNLDSLHDKAVAAGVGTTAPDGLPSLCPPKSTIAGYVTNGSTTVNISGTWADNQLVDDANVAINKTITSTGTTYRNVSVGTSTVSDIPASGGSVAAYATVTYEWALVTYYSDGSSTTGNYTSASQTIYGSSVSGNDLGTTLTNRTYKGTSTPSGTVAGATRTGTACSVYQAANYITKAEPTSSEGATNHFTYASDTISAAGGSVTPSNTGRCKYTFSSGSTSTNESTTPFTNVTATYSRTYSKDSDTYSKFTLTTSSGKVSAENCGTSKTDGYSCRIKGVLTVTVSYASGYSGLSAPTGTLTQYKYIYQQANAITGGYFWFTGGQVSDIPASGGTSAIPNITMCKWYDIYTSGDELGTAINSSYVTWAYGKNSSNSYSGVTFYSSSSYGKYTASATTSTSRTLLGYTVVRGYYNGSYDYIVRSVYQAAYSGPTASSYYLEVYTNSLSESDYIPSSGGTSGAVTLQYARFHTVWSDNSDTYTDVTSSVTKQYGLHTQSRSSATSEPSWYSSSSYSQYTKNSINTSTSNVTVGYYACMKCTYNGYSQWDTSTIWQKGKKPASYSLYIEANDIGKVPAAGGTSESITLKTALFITTYDNGQNSSSDCLSACSKYYSSSTSAPTSTSTTNTDSSASQITCAANTSSSEVTRGYAIIRCLMNGKWAWTYKPVKQLGTTTPTTGYNVRITPPQYNGTNCTTCAANFANSSGTVLGTAHARTMLSSTSHYNWSSSGTVSKLVISENNTQTGPNKRPQYVTVLGYMGNTLLNKGYIGDIQYGSKNLSTSFNTSDYNNGSRTIYITYYFS